jgi:hypothetical protein
VGITFAGVEVLRSETGALGHQPVRARRDIVEAEGTVVAGFGRCRAASFIGFEGITSWA